MSLSKDWFGFRYKADHGTSVLFFTSNSRTGPIRYAQLVRQGRKMEPIR